MGETHVEMMIQLVELLALFVIRFRSRVDRVISVEKILGEPYVPSPSVELA